MGNREDLIEGARRCIIEKGYARTTARDIAGAAGVSLAAIGYHYGSKEALMTEALLSTGIQIGDSLDAALRNAPASELLGRIWDESLRVFADQRELLAASMENLAQIDRLPVVADTLRAAQQAAISGIAELLAETLPELDAEQRRALAAYYFAMVNGLAVTWLVDPAGMPSGKQLGQLLPAPAPPASDASSPDAAGSDAAETDAAREDASPDGAGRQP
jgi:AcrR family transcriptional regulator